MPDVTLTLAATEAVLLEALADRWQEPAAAIMARWIQERLWQYRVDRVRDLGIPPREVHALHVDGGTDSTTPPAFVRGN